MASTQQDQQRFLARFETPQRAGIGNDFLAVIRAGQSDPDTILWYVRREAQYQAARGDERSSAVVRARLLLAALDGHDDEARDLAAYYVAWEALPRAERERIKRERAGDFAREWMAGQPATPKQLDYLRALGHTGPVGDRAAASRLIDELLGKGARR